MVGEVVDGSGFLLTESRVGLAPCFSRAGPEVDWVEEGGGWSCLDGRPRSIMIIHVMLSEALALYLYLSHYRSA